MCYVRLPKRARLLPASSLFWFAAMVYACAACGQAGGANERSHPAASTTHSLKMWRVLEKGAFRGHGQVEAKDDQILLPRGQLGTGVAWRNPMPRSNYEVSFEAKKIAGKDFFCGLTFPVESGTDTGQRYCTLILGGWGGKVTGLSNVDGEPAVENETVSFHEYQAGRWYNVRLRVTPRRIEAWVDRQQIVDLETSDRQFSIWIEQEPARPLGISSWETSAAFRRFQVKPYTASKPAGSR